MAKEKRKPEEPEIGDEFIEEWSGGERTYRLVEVGGPSWRRSDPEEVLIIEEDDKTFYVKLNEGTKEMFAIYVDDPSYPMIRRDGSYMDINFFNWIAQREGIITSKHYSETPLHDESICRWRDVRNL